MSIEALLEAAEYVDRKTEEIPAACADRMTLLQSGSPAGTNVIADNPKPRAETHHTAHGTLKAVLPQATPSRSRADGPSGQAGEHAVTQQNSIPMRLQAHRSWLETPSVGVDVPSFHFYRPLNGSSSLQKNTLMTVITKEDVSRRPEASVESRTVRIPTAMPQVEPSNPKLSDAPKDKRTIQIIQKPSDTQLVESVSHVMRHPGYDVSWSYSAPEIRAPSPTPEPPDRGDGQDELMTSEGEDGRKTGVREVHNKLEKNRRAHLKGCFDDLKDQIPTLQDRKVKISNSNILSGACRYIGALKRKEKELEHELDWLVREKIRKQKLLHRLKMEKGKVLHVGMHWHQEGSVLTSDLLPQPSGKEKRQEREEEDKDSTSTASEAEEEERKSWVDVSSAVATPVTMTTTITSSQASSCKTVTSPSVSESVASHGHPLKNHLLREHRAQEAMKTTLIPAVPAAESINSVATANTKPSTVIPNMPVSPSARPTVSQLLGKQSTPVRQPVRRQAPSLPIPAVVNPVGYPVQRYQVPLQSFIRQGLGQHELAVRPSQPVVTIGVTPAVPPGSEVKLLQGQTLPVISQPLKIPNRQLMSTTNSLGQSVSIMSTSLQPAFHHPTISGVPAVTSLAQAIMPPITLAPMPIKQVLLTNSKLAGYAAVPGLTPTLLAPSSTPTLVSPFLTTIYPRPLLPQGTVTISTNGTLMPSHYVTASGTKVTNSQVASHHLTTVPVLNPRSLPHAVPKKPKSPKVSKTAGRNLLPARTKPLITTSQMEKACMAKAGVLKTVIVSSAR